MGSSSLPCAVEISSIARQDSALFYRIRKAMYKTFGIFIPQNEPLHVECLLAFSRGLERRRIPYAIFPLENGYQPCDIAVTFGVRKKRTERGRCVGAIIEQHENESNTNQHIVVERGFIHRDRYFMVGWGGLNGRADFRNANSPHDRFRKLRVKVLPWRIAGEHIVLCGQIPWDAAVQDSDHVQWCRETAVQLAQMTSRRIVFRPHPLQPHAIDMTSFSVVVSEKASLAEDLENAWAVVTFNSNAGVEATLAGIPAFVSDRGAMGFSLLNRSLNTIETPFLPERRQWLSDLAYSQWTLDEIASGRTIYHLFEREYAFLSRYWHKAHLESQHIKNVIANSFQRVGFSKSA